MDIIEITSEKIDVGKLLSLMKNPSSGGTSCFIGTTRDTFDLKKVVHLEYEAYHTMAEKVLRRIAQIMKEKWPLTNVVLVHRVGTVPVTEVSVLVAASAVHRKEAIEAVTYGIDKIKADAPIWKKEKYEDGTCNWKENCECIRGIQSSQSGLLPKPTFHEPLKYIEVRNYSSSSTKQVENLYSNNQYKTGDPPRKGRASLVRLQAVVDSPNTGVTQSSSSNPDTSSSKVTSSDSSNRSTSLTTKSYDWTVSTSDNSHVSGNSFADAHFSSASEEVEGSSVLTSTSNFDEVPNTQEMQRFLTLDGQYVYGYKDTNGEFHFFYPTLNDRESHNEKERKRRSRVSDACSSLRQLVPGLNEKTDKASVFEQTARYLKFLRNKYGTQFDQAYCEKYLLEKS